MRDGGSVAQPPTAGLELYRVIGGLGGDLAIGLGLVVYLLATPQGPNRTWLWAVVIAAKLVPLVTQLRWMRGLPSLRPATERDLYVWCWSTVAVLILAVWLDGGHGSAVRVLMALPLAFAALVLPIRAIVTLATTGVAGDLVVGVLTGTLVGSDAVLLAVTVAALVWMCSRIAASHRRQAEELERRAAGMHELAHRDALTGAMNRRAFEACVDRALASGVEVGMLLFDVDRFKQLNDGRGHLVGDRLLIELTKLLRAGARDSDQVARLGGDEFAVILLGAGTEETAAIARRFVEELDGRGPLEGLRVSVGSAHSSETGSDREQLIGAADRRMYRAKRADPGAPAREELAGA